MGYRAEATAPEGAFQGEGLLAVEPADGAPVHVFSSPTADRELASIRATLHGTHLLVEADGAVTHTTDEGRGGMDGALARWADRFAGAMGVGRIRPAPRVWCSWYHYFAGVTESAIRENVEAIGRLDLPVDVVQIDDGYQAGIGDWLTPSERFRSLADVARDIRVAGLRAGIWLAPFLVGASSRLAAEHPDWLVGDADAGWNWDQSLHALDTTNPDARAWLGGVLLALRDLGFDYFKVDFVYAAALPGRRHAAVTPIEAYRSGLELIRAAIGDSYLLACGAPILPSVGLVDAMRVSPDTAPHFEPGSGDLSAPGARSAIVTGRARAFQHARFWVNDPDCLIVRPEVERRDEWADHVERFGGLRASSDRLADLDTWGLARTRELLANPPPDPFVAS